MPSIVRSGIEFKYDECDQHIIDSRKWWVTPQGYLYCHIKQPSGKRRAVCFHRVVMGDPALPSVVDHINRDKSDNRRQNLRVCSRSENNRNKAMAKGKSSKYHGVSLNRGKWCVVVRIDGRVKWLGSFDNEARAAEVAAPYFADVA